MKLRIDPESISYRLDFDELEKLLAEGQLVETLALPEDHLTYRVTCLPHAAEASFQAQDQTFHLTLSRDSLLEHKAALPSLKGIIHSFPTQKGGTLDVSLEVNLKKKIKRSLS